MKNIKKGTRLNNKNDNSVINNLVIDLSKATKVNIDLKEKLKEKDKLIENYEKELKEVQEKLNKSEEKFSKLVMLYKEMIKEFTNIVDPDSKIHKSFIKKSEMANTGNYCRNGNPSTHRNYGNQITKKDAKVILEMWKTKQAKEIAEIFPQYNAHQIGNYCSKHSDFAKKGVTKEFIAELRSYNGTKTIAELIKIYGNKNLKRLCINHNIPYKEKEKKRD